jgi:(hydroxyamino)benzene mutase
MPTDRKRSLLWHGAMLFLLGLLTGFLQQQFRNPRMGLAAHLEGLMNGTFLIAVGAVWAEVKLSERLSKWTFGTAIYGAYANWGITFLAAVFGTNSMTPLAGAGHQGAKWQETLVGAGFASVALAITTTAVLLLVGFRRQRAVTAPAAISSAPGTAQS